MTEARKKEIARLVWNLKTAAKDCGHAKGLKSGLEGAGFFNPNVNPDEAIRGYEVDVEQTMNELFAALGMRDYQEHNCTESENNAE